MMRDTEYSVDNWVGKHGHPAHGLVAPDDYEPLGIKLSKVVIKKDDEADHDELRRHLDEVKNHQS
jgi:hypothetical protein